MRMDSHVYRSFQRYPANHNHISNKKSSSSPSPTLNFTRSTSCFSSFATVRTPVRVFVVPLLSAIFACAGLYTDADVAGLVGTRATFVSRVDVFTGGRTGWRIPLTTLVVDEFSTRFLVVVVVVPVLIRPAVTGAFVVAVVCETTDSGRMPFSWEGSVEDAGVPEPEVEVRLVLRVPELPLGPTSRDWVRKWRGRGGIGLDLWFAKREGEEIVVRDDGPALVLAAGLEVVLVGGLGWRTSWNGSSSSA